MTDNGFMSNSEKGIYQKIIKQPTSNEIQVGDKLILKGMRRSTRIGIEVMETHKSYWDMAEDITGKSYFAPGEILSLWRSGEFVYESPDSLLPIYQGGPIREQ